MHDVITLNTGAWERSLNILKQLSLAFLFTLKGYFSDNKKYNFERDNSFVGLVLYVQL